MSDKPDPATLEIITRQIISEERCGGEYQAIIFTQARDADGCEWWYYTEIFESRIALDVVRGDLVKIEY